MRRIIQLFILITITNISYGLDINKRPYLKASVIKWTSKYDIDNKLMLAILFKESSWRNGVINCNKSCDYGIAQINEANIKAYKLDKMRLLTDIDYSVQKSVYILKWFKDRYAHKEKHWWARYNCGVEKNCLNWKKTKDYIQKVVKYKAVIDD